MPSAARFGLSPPVSVSAFQNVSFSRPPPSPQTPSRPIPEPPIGGPVAAGPESNSLTRELTRHHPGVEELFRRAVFNIAAGNDDDHGRNHAFLMDPDGSWRLAPAYDLTLATHPLASGIRASAVQGKLRAITRGDLVRLGDEHGVRRIADTIDRVLGAVAKWPEFAAAAGISAHILEDCRERMPLLG